MDHPYICAARQIPASAADAEGGLVAKIQKRDWELECYRPAARPATAHGNISPRAEAVAAGARGQLLCAEPPGITGLVVCGFQSDFRVDTTVR